jgi:hypothetical protein
VATTTTTPLVAGITASDIWQGTVRALAEVRVLDEAELLAEIAANGGDLVIKSKEAEVIISVVEVDVLGDVELVDQSHLRRGQLSSLPALSDLLWRRWAELHGAAGA